MSHLNPTFSEQPHRRYNPLNGEWLLVSPHRAKRPWLGQVEKLPPDTLPTYDPQCYLCPGNSRSGGILNPAYPGVFTFDNDFPAILADTPPTTLNDQNLLVAQTERGIAQVICFSPHHDLTLAKMDTTDITSVIDAWAQAYTDLGALDYVNHVQIFENRGEMMGASNPHPHCQIWAQESIPNEVAKELAQQQNYFQKHGTQLLADYLRLELKAGERIVCRNDDWVALVPFWAVWPFETLLLPLKPVGSLADLNPAERAALADILKRLTTRYDNLFETSFPYSMGFHQTPTDGKTYPGQVLHAHFFPPLLRSATIRKFMVGYELLGNPQRDITPETAAERLRELSETHFTVANR